MNFQTCLRAGLLAGTGALALAVSPAFAAEAAAPAADAASPETDSTGLTEIVVTATKRETNLQQTPISISVMGADDLKKRHVQSLMDLADGSVPSLRISTFEARQSALTIGIRGIVPDDANQPAREQGVGVYLDGVYLGRQHGLNASLYDVERVEVLKGPQGTLFGRNTEGGALSMVLKAPTGEFGGRLQAGVGNYGSYNAQLHLDLPEYHNISIKLDGVLQHQDPTIKNPLAGQAGWNQYHRYGGRIAARWKPTSDLTIDLAFDKSRDENTPFYSQLVTITPSALANIPKDANGTPLISTAMAVPPRPISVCRSSRASTSPRASPGTSATRCRRASNCARSRVAHGQRRTVGQLGRRAPHAGLGAERQLQPLFAGRAAPAPVQPGTPGGRFGRQVRLRVRPVLLQRTRQRLGAHAEHQQVERGAQRLHHQRSVDVPQRDAGARQHAWAKSYAASAR
jgi:iron complex outermembrane receptor protein